MYKVIAVDEIVSKKITHPCGQPDSLIKNEEFMRRFFAKIEIEDEEEYDEDYFMRVVAVDTPMINDAFDFLDDEELDCICECYLEEFEDRPRKEKEKLLFCSELNEVELIGLIFEQLSGMRYEYPEEGSNVLEFESE